MNSTKFENQWNAELYDSKHSYISELATDLVELLSPKPGEYILDLGCGTGHLTHKIASKGAAVIGIDSAPTMIEQACQNYRQLDFTVVDARNLPFTEKFDAVFSNAVLHWIQEAEEVVVGINRALKPGGRFVAEFGGKGNVKAIVSAIYNAVQTAGYPADAALNPWYFPSIAEYGSLLEKHGLQLTFATLFERPTLLEDGEQGMQNWLKMFANSFFSELSLENQMSILADIENQLRPALYKDGNWFADYRRIRVIAMKV
ncbi:class I SAM-dependent methyltransferase [Mastigocladopsis repens]|uniref:class I SAM-dependent methyltransferase n=1 Tax=Mastigocladopsis repens TaxID=221287 RepID=UPI0002D5E176|nr:class I SAM-dependent methyltransferase [Mastigocladopsis repens]